MSDLKRSPSKGGLAESALVAAAGVCMVMVCAAAYADEPETQPADAATNRPAAGLSLLGALDLLVEGKPAPALKDIRALYKRHKDDPYYFLAYGCAYIAVRNDSLAASALKRAVMLKKDIYDAHLQLALVYARMDRTTVSDRHFLEAQLLAPDSPLLWYAMALEHLRNRRWEQSRALLEEVVKTGGQPAKLARARLLRFDVLEAESRRVEQTLTQAKAALGMITNALSEAKTKGRAAVEAKAALPKQFEAELEEIEQAHKDRVREVEKLYGAELPPPALADVDADLYHRRKAQADANRARRLREARSTRDEAYRRTELYYKEKDRELARTIEAMRAEVLTLQKVHRKRSADFDKAHLDKRKQDRRIAGDFTQDSRIFATWTAARLRDAIRYERPLTTQPTSRPATQPAGR